MRIIIGNDRQTDNQTVTPSARALVTLPAAGVGSCSEAGFHGLVGGGCDRTVMWPRTGLAWGVPCLWSGHRDAGGRAVRVLATCNVRSFTGSKVWVTLDLAMAGGALAWPTVHCTGLHMLYKCLLGQLGGAKTNVGRDELPCPTSKGCVGVSIESVSRPDELG